MNKIQLKLRRDKRDTNGLFGQVDGNDVSFCLTAINKLWPRLNGDEFVMTVSYKQEAGLTPIVLHRKPLGFWRWEAPTMSDDGSMTHYFGFNDEIINKVIARFTHRSPAKLPKQLTVWVNLARA